MNWVAARSRAILPSARRFACSGSGSRGGANYAARKFGDPDFIRTGSSDADGVQWIDVGFWIRPDGHTAEAEILRSSRSHPWSPTVLAQIAGRRYGATGSGAGDGEGTYRIERVTKRSRYMTPGGSLVVRRVRDDGLEILDLTRAADRPTG
jgi:hypothetical protein